MLLLKMIPPVFCNNYMVYWMMDTLIQHQLWHRAACYNGIDRNSVDSPVTPDKIHQQLSELFITSNIIRSGQRVSRRDRIFRNPPCFKPKPSQTSGFLNFYLLPVFWWWHFTLIFKMLAEICPVIETTFITDFSDWQIRVFKQPAGMCYSDTG